MKGRLARLAIVGHPEAKRVLPLIEEIKKSYSDTWVDLSKRLDLHPEFLYLFVSHKDGIVIEVQQDAGIAITLARYFPMPAWLGPASPPASSSWAAAMN